MKLLWSRFYRIHSKIKPPELCFAIQHLPESLNEECDCKVFCKFPPKGNSPIYNQCNKDLNNENCELILLYENYKSLNYSETQKN